jgi:BASS family bile acid:Na+ symporter
MNMAAGNRLVALPAAFIQAHFLWLLLGSYALAAFLPAPGLSIRRASLGEINFLTVDVKLSSPGIMLAFFLVNAGLSVYTSQWRRLLCSPAALLAGMAANLLIPIVFILVATRGMHFWHNPVEVQHVLVGLALVGSMPIAGSSTAWSQNAQGDLALSLGLVLLSTFLSPLTTPLALQSVGLMAEGEYRQMLHDLAAPATGTFLAMWVLLPCLLGVLARGSLGEARVAPARPLLRLANSVNLLLLNYSNASISLPQAVAEPDWDFLAMLLGNVAGLCALAFASGWVIARLMRLDHAQTASLIFGLGLNNNGTGLVLASMACAVHHRVMLPIIVYNLIQHLGAGAVDFLLKKPHWRPRPLPVGEE